MSDYANRVKILRETLDKNVLVCASAGSGKTTLLVKRLVALIESSDDVKINQIVAITFTKKAANEFYERFYNMLFVRSNVSYVDKDDILGVPTDETRARVLEALRNIDTCYLGTIDGFINRLLSENPLVADIPPSSIIIDDEELDTILLNNYYNILSNSSDPLYEEAKLFNANIGVSDFTRIARIFLENSNYKEKNTHYFDVTKEIFEIEINKFIEALKDFVELPNYHEYLDTSTAPKSAAYNYLVNNINNLDSFKSIFAFKNFIKSDFNSIAFLKRPDNLIDYTCLNSKTKKTYFVLNDKFNNMIYQYNFNIILEFMIDFNERIVSLLKRKGALTFHQALIHTVDMLRKDGENDGIVTKHLHEKYRYYFIDECQDTDLLQYELFFRLTSNKIAGEFWLNELKPREGSLFIVGDRKQSIYHFRGADVGCYDMIARLFDNENPKRIGVTIPLTDNFRSNYNLCQYFDDTFQDEIFASLHYEPIKKSKDSISIEKSEIFNGAYKYSSDKDDPNFVAKAINYLMKNQHLVYPKLNKNGDVIPLSYKDFMVITHSKKHLSEYLKALSEQHIPVFCEGEINFKFTDLLRALFLIFNYFYTRDKLSLMELAVSPIFSFDLTKDCDLCELEKYINCYFSYLSKPCISYSSFLENVINHEDMLLKLGTSGLDVCLGVVNLLREQELAGNINSPKDACDFINKLQTSSEIERISLIGNNVDAVRIANLHKVKGLQARIVFLAKYKIRNSTPMLHKDTDYNVSYFDFTLSIDEPPYKKCYGKTQEFLIEPEYNDEKDYEANEHLRLLYVGATRAESVLFINDNEDGWKNLIIKIPDENYLDSSIFSDTTFSTDDAVCSLETKVNDFSSSNNFSKENFTIKNGSANDAHIFKAGKENDLYSSLDVELEKIDDPLIFGSAVHRLMEIICNAKSNTVDDSVCYTISNELTSSSDLVHNLLVIKEKIYNGGFFKNNDAEIVDIYKLMKNYECHTEVPYSYMDNNELHYGIIDLLVEKDNEILIIDYKTDTVLIDHSTQLRLYKDAVEKLYPGKKISTFIYHIC